MVNKKKTKMTIWQYLTLGYLTVIIVGTLLLLLPFATNAGEPQTGFVDALFTATSATCITGLIPFDTATHFTLFGQIVILCMIQLGGLGFMTFVTIIFRTIGKKSGVYETKALMLSAGEDNRQELHRLFRNLLIGTLIFELIGAAVLSIRFIPEFGFGQGVYFSVWHSVSAFCNAGFDLMGGVHTANTFVSLTHYASDPLVCITISLLICIGGLGFCVWDDIWVNRFQIKKYKLHTKVVLLMTAIILLLSTVLFLLFEWSNPEITNLNFWQKSCVAFFNACTPRTAGFSVIDYSTASDGSYLLTLMSMFIGGSPASTAGGVKTTTLFVIIMGTISVFQGKRDIEVGKRRVHNSLLRQALAVFVACLFLTMISCLLIGVLESGNAQIGIKEILFEVVSAIANVGLSMGVTPDLTVASKIILALLMFVGRVGIVTFALAFAERTDAAEVKKPVDTMLIG